MRENATENITLKDTGVNSISNDTAINLNDTDHPLQLVIKWMEEAKHMGLDNSDAMNVATVGKDGRPRNRMVLMRHLTTSEIGFFTNLSSDKSKEIIANPNVSATIWWPNMSRQVRIQGIAQPMNRDTVRAYFHTRPRKSQIAAWTSKQSQPLQSMQALHEKFHTFEQQFSDQEIPLPDFWGGYTISVEEIEFWCGKPFRLHERIRLTSRGSTWIQSRLYP